MALSGRIHNCYCHPRTGLVAVVCAHGEGGTIYFNAELVNKMLVITKRHQWISIPFPT